MEFFVRRMAEYLNYTNPHFRPSSRNPPRTIHEAPSREGQPENYQQLTINLHLNRTRQYGQSIVNAIAVLAVLPTQYQRLGRIPWLYRLVVHRSSVVHGAPN